MRESYMMDDIFLRTFLQPAVMPDTYSNSNRYPNMNTSKYTTSKEGFLRGNMLAKEYIPYKNMTYLKPNITNEKDKMLYDIQEVSFAAHDVNLYLDTHPNDTESIMLYNKYNEKANKLTMDYERKYGPIDLSDNMGLESTPWAWIKEPWPWNNR